MGYNGKQSGVTIDTVKRLLQHGADPRFNEYCQGPPMWLQLLNKDNWHWGIIHADKVIQYVKTVSEYVKGKVVINYDGKKVAELCCNANFSNEELIQFYLLLELLYKY